ncbi:MAG: Cysteine synthase [Thermotogales bacterium 46_20]|nr:MAG: Cysteine synthase [Thermotogales bacterium 46_20]
MHIHEMPRNTRTSMVEIDGFHIAVKLEGQHPCGSVKDRCAFFMIDHGEKAGLLKAGYTIVEPTSGNTGIALAGYGSRKGYRVVLTMPESVSCERVKILKAHGAEVVLTASDVGIRGAMEKAKEILEGVRNAYMPDQFSNPANPLSHELTTGPEILSLLGSRIGAFVAGVGTGGTITGVGRCLRRYIPDIELVAVEPLESPVLSGGEPGAHEIQGIGPGFVAENVDRSVITSIELVGSEEAKHMCRFLARNKGLFLGISSAANIVAALKIAEKLGKDKTVVTVSPDFGYKYLSLGLF